MLICLEDNKDKGSSIAEYNARDRDETMMWASLSVERIE